MVIAESHLAAQDACELIEVVYEDLPAIVDPEEALMPGAPQLHDDVPGNCPVEAECGNGPREGGHERVALSGTRAVRVVFEVGVRKTRVSEPSLRDSIRQSSTQL